MKKAIMTKIKLLQGKSSILVKMFIKNIFDLNLSTAKRKKYLNSNVIICLNFSVEETSLPGSPEQDVSVLGCGGSSTRVGCGWESEQQRGLRMSVSLCPQEKGQ